ncbi:MAG: NfeD family protein [Ktedonobacterales bacterium]
MTTIHFPHTPHRQLLRLMLALTIALLTGVGLFAAMGLQAPLARADSAHIDLVTFNQDITPASARFLTDAIGTAQSDGASLLVITLDTPGGDVTSMETIVQSELASKVPIAIYVGDAGAHAASAGMFVALAAPIVAMAPDTRIGAASPIDSSGQNLSSTLDTKVKNDLITLITPIQVSYHRNPQPAVQAITSAAAFDDTQAVQDHLVDMQVTSRADLLNRLDGYTAAFHDGTPFTLVTQGIATQQLQPTFANIIETVIFDPTVLFVLFLVAAVCIYLELSHPGVILPGTLGAIALILFFFGSGSLQPNWVGFVLMALAIVLLAVDVRAPTHGVLTIGALISFVIGSLIFFDTGPDIGAQDVSPYVVVGSALGLGLVALVVLRYAIGAQLRRDTTGKAGFIGKTAKVIAPLGVIGSADGRVMLQGENWLARLAQALPPGAAPIGDGQMVRVKRVEGLRLIVEPLPVTPSSTPPAPPDATPTTTPMMSAAPLPQTQQPYHS